MIRIIILLLFSCNVYAQNNVLVNRYGADGFDNLDDTQAFINAFDYYRSSKKGKFIIPEGTYYLTANVFSGVVDFDVEIEGQGDVTIYQSYQRTFDFSARGVVTTLNSSSHRGDLFCKVNNIGGAEVGDIVAILSDQAGDTNWNYPENELHKIAEISVDTIFFDSPNNFSYIRGEESITVTTYKPLRISISNLKFKTQTVGADGFLFLRYCVADINNISFESDGFTTKTPVQTLGLINSTFNNLRFQNFQYGVNLTRSRNSSFNNINAINQSHPVSIAVYCTNTFLNNMTGHFTGIDIHPSFNTIYSNCYFSEGSFALRGAGITLKNCVFEYFDRVQLLQLGVPNWAAHNQGFVDEYSVVFDNVIVRSDLNDARIQMYGGLSNVNINNCELLDLTYTTDEKVNLTISNSKIGSINHRSGDVNVDNCTFTSENKNPNFDFFLTRNLGGAFYISDSHFEGSQGDDFLFFQKFATEKAHFNNCTFDSLTNIFVSTSTTKGYANMIFENCKYTNQEEIFTTDFLNNVESINSKFENVGGNNYFNNKGTTAQRPIMGTANVGFRFFDTTLNYPVFWNGLNWVNSSGAIQ